MTHQYCILFGCFTQQLFALFYTIEMGSSSFQTAQVSGGFLRPFENVTSA